MPEFDIPQDEALRILRDMIVPQATRGVKASAAKEAFILGGQPGSGKSAFAREILKKNQNLVFINGDDLRAYHPNYYFYLRENDVEAADRTQAVCNFWIEGLVTACINQGLGFIIEGTMRRTDGPLQTAREAREGGYRLNLVAIATPYELSLLSLARRYQEIKELEGFARYTKKESHDEAYDNIERTFTTLASSDMFEKIFIYKRFPGGFEECLFDRLEAERALAELQEGRTRVVTEKEKEIRDSRLPEINIRKH